MRKYDVKGRVKDAGSVVDEAIDLLKMLKKEELGK